MLCSRQPPARFRSTTPANPRWIYRSSTPHPSSKRRAGVPAGAAASEVVSPAETVQSLRKPRFDWKRQWYPVAIVDDLPVDRPTAVVVLGKDLVVWRDGAAQWRAFEDKCPHRMVPLSEGRVETDGTLQCAYHGWRFAGSGECTTIPQALTPEQDAKVSGARRACATAYPTCTVDELLFVWMDAGPGAFEESAQRPPKHFDSYRKDGTRVARPWHIRDSPIGWQVVMENSTDPSHVPFSHHGIQGLNRAKPSRPNFTEIKRMDCDAGFLVSTPSGTPAPITTIEMDPPNFGAMTVKSGNGTTFMKLHYHIVPVTPGRSRMFIRFELERLAGSWRGALARLRPKWLVHRRQNAVMDGDAVFLTRQSQCARGGVIEHARFYLPTPADLPTIALTQWVRRFAPDGIDFYDDVRDEVDASRAVLPRKAALDRYEHHVKHCPSCQGALRNVRLGLAAIPWVAGAAFLALAASLGQGLGLLALRPVASCCVLILCLALRVGLSRLEKEFLFTDYVHAERN